MFQDGIESVDRESLSLPPLAKMFFSIGENTIFLGRRHGVILILDGVEPFLA